MNRISMFFALFAASFYCSAKELPIKDFATYPEFKQFKISPNGKTLAFTFEEEDQVKLAIMDAETKKVNGVIGAGKDGRGIDRFMWATNERLVLLSSKITGLHDGQSQSPKLGAVNIDGSKRYLLWDYQRSNVDIVSLLKDDPRYILINKTHWADKEGAKLHKMDIMSGKTKYIVDSPKLFGKENAYFAYVRAGLDDVPRIALEVELKDIQNDDDNVTRMHYKNSSGEWSILTFPDNKRKKVPSSTPLGFSADNNKFYFASNFDLKEDGPSGFFEFDLVTEKISLLFRHDDVDISSAVFGKNGEVIGAKYHAGYPEIFYLNNKFVSDEVNFHKSIRAAFSPQDVYISSYSESGSLATVRVFSDTNPGDFYIFDRAKNKATYIASSHPQIKPKEMSTVEPFVFVARDGLKMYGQMTIPKGKKLDKLPMVIYPHGGPYGVRDQWGWDWRAQLLANRGYLVVQLDFRGSGGYGIKFIDAGRGEWGGKMQDDLTDVTNWAIKKGYADADRVCIYGGSYGGYAAMQAVVKEPDLYKCSIPEAGIYEIRLQWDEADSFKNRRKAGERYLVRMLGKDVEKGIKERSPGYHVDKLKAALFIIHGTKDKRTPIDNAYFLEKKLKEANKPYSTYYREDGHGFRKMEYRLESSQKILDFLDKHIGSK